MCFLWYWVRCAIQLRSHQDEAESPRLSQSSHFIKRPLEASTAVVRHVLFMHHPYEPSISEMAARKLPPELVDEPRSSFRFQGENMSPCPRFGLAVQPHHPSQDLQRKMHYQNYLKRNQINMILRKRESGRLTGLRVVLSEKKT